MENLVKNKKSLKALAGLLKLLAFGLGLYLILLPFYPKIKYYLSAPAVKLDAQDYSQVAAQVLDLKNKLPEAEYSISPNRLIIPKIDVNAPITESTNEQVGLSLGAWLIPWGSTPDKGGNTIITGHRFKYLPPNNLTFFLFDKLAVGDIFSVFWKDKQYFYRVREIKVLEDYDSSPYNKSDVPILTMYTCTPIYSTAQRLVIISDLINSPESSN
jgi:LPXTG-site transpeptidase (sortase) family protein